MFVRLTLSTASAMRRRDAVEDCAKLVAVPAIPHAECVIAVQSPNAEQRKCDRASERKLQQAIVQAQFVGASQLMSGSEEKPDAEATERSLRIIRKRARFLDPAA